MRQLTAKTTFRAALVLSVAAIAIVVGGCGRTTLTGVSQDQLSSGVEPYFNVGSITYQVQVSRAMNAFNEEDAQYFAGVQDAQNLPAGQLWYGVWLWAKNQTDRIVRSADTFKLVDSEGTVYKATPLNPSVNPYAWTSQALSQNDIEPLAGSAASNSSDGGGLILFKVSESVYSNRPLTLEIFAPGSGKPAKVSLDL